MPVHDCMGLPLDVEGGRWGVVTLDALEVGTFDAQAQRDLGALACVIEAAVRITRLEAEVRALRLSRGPTPLGTHSPREESDIVGQSEAITHLLHELQVVADSELPVLLLGETGVQRAVCPSAAPTVTPRSQATGACELRSPARVTGRK